MVAQVNLIKNAECPEHDFSALTGSDLEFVKCSGKNHKLLYSLSGMVRQEEFVWPG